MIACLLFSIVLLSVSVNGQCPAGQFLDGSWCCACNSLSNCRQVTCRDRTTSTCVRCASGYVLKSGKCVQNCASTQFWDSQYNQCCECGTIANCVDRTCSTKSAVTCHTCKTGFTLVNNQCVSRPTCVAPQFYDAAFNQCCDCGTIANCVDRTCSSKTAVTCHACAQGYVLINNKCVVKPTCVSGSYYDATTNTCPACNPVPNCATRTCRDRNSVTCTKCASGYRLINGVCSVVPTCKPGTFYDAAVNTCCDCISIANCAARTCTDKNGATCTSCISGYVLKNNQCVKVPTCSAGTFLDKTSNTCVACKTIINCGQRTCTNAVTSTCIRCTTGYRLNNNICEPIPTCSAGTFLDVAINQCCDCTPVANCVALTCKDKSASTCSKCHAGFVLRSGKCVKVPTCTGATFLDVAINQCCDCTPIDNCAAVTCKDKSSSTCSQCLSGYVLQNGKCVKVPICTGATFLDVAINQCSPCTAIAQCTSLSCKSKTSSTCGKCAAGYVLKDNKCVKVPTCTGATFLDTEFNICCACTPIANCATGSLTCNSKAASTCTKCDAGYFLKDNKCEKIPTCAAGTFLDRAINQCTECTDVLNCADGSLTCTSKAGSTCTKCKAGYVLINNQCAPVPKCTGATFLDVAINKCCDCTPIANCAADSLKCTSKSSSTCSACNSGFVLSNNVCVAVPTCTKRQYLDVAKNVCVNCNFPTGCTAGNCQASGLTCTTCDGDFVLINGQCVIKPTCSRSQYYTVSDNKCHGCNFPANCADGSCNTASDAICTLCATGFTLINGVCVAIPTCSSSQYYVAKSNTCVNCPLPPNCVSGFCSDATTLHCVTCAAGYVNMANRGCVAIPTCSATQYLDTTTNTCKDCVSSDSHCADASCKSAVSATCIRCVAGFNLVDGVCQEIPPPTPNCEPGTYLDAAAYLCKPCKAPANCATADVCSGPEDFTCAECKPGFFVLDGQCLPVPAPPGGSGSGSKPAPPSGSGSGTGSGSGSGGIYHITDTSAFEGTSAATETTTISEDGSTTTTVTSGSDNSNNNSKAFAIAVGVFAGVVVVLLVTLVVVLVTRGSSNHESV